MKKIVILGGGTFNHIRNHLSLAVPAFGSTARKLRDKINNKLLMEGLDSEYVTQLYLTKMADPQSKIVTNEDVSNLVDILIDDPSVKAIVFNMAITDFDGQIGDVVSGKYADRLQTKNGEYTIDITPSDKIISRVRKTRKDIFLIGFKTTSNADSNTQYNLGLELMKKNSVNLVLANDTVTRNNMIIVPEESRYCETTNREEVLDFLVKMMVARMQCSFTRSTVVEGQPVDWRGKLVPSNLRDVVNHCIEQGAYKPFLGKTVGHFAVKVDDTEILTSVRKTNFNHLDDVGLVRIHSKNSNEVIAEGRKPSVGGMSQRIIFENNPDLDCIVHFHSPVRPESVSVIPSRPQWQNECGSHECGQNTNDGLQEFTLDNDNSLYVVYLENHGPNIVFNKETPSNLVVEFIDKHFDLSLKTDH